MPLLLATVAAPFLPRPTPIYAASIVVNSALDNTIAGDTACTLREAIINANRATAPFDQSGGDCVAGTNGADEIQCVIGTGSQTIALGSALPNIVQPLTISGYTQPGTPHATPNTLPDAADGTNAIIATDVSVSH